MAATPRELAESLLNGFMARDKARILACFAPNGLLIDPHYPQPAMQGHEAIAAGLDFAFGMLAQPGFTVRHAWQDESSCVLEVDTHHTFVTGQVAQFPQVFVFEFAGELIARVQSYVPYPPPAP